MTTTSAPVAALFPYTTLFRSTRARADDAQETRQLVEKAKLSAEQFQTDSNMGALRDYAKKARGMLILPQMLRAAFIVGGDRKSTRLNSSHLGISYAVFCLKKK